VDVFMGIALSEHVVGIGARQLGDVAVADPVMPGQGLMGGESPSAITETALALER
jgi:hypothetical protein